MADIELRNLIKVLEIRFSQIKYGSEADSIMELLSVYYKVLNKSIVGNRLIRKSRMYNVNFEKLNYIASNYINI